MFADAYRTGEFGPAVAQKTVACRNVKGASMLLPRSAAGLRLFRGALPADMLPASARCSVPQPASIKTTCSSFSPEGVRAYCFALPLRLHRSARWRH